MNWFTHWWERDVIDAAKLPLMLCFLAFVVTFLVTRTITRLIRDGRGPFKNNISSSGVHIHHAVPGIVCLIAGAFISLGPSAQQSLAIAGGGAVLIGVGTSLVLDEFALILHLTDVYWTAQGRLSVHVVSLAAACLGLALVGFSPVGVANVGASELGIRLSATTLIGINLVLVLFCVIKGKYVVAALAILVPGLSLVGAVRLARPDSVWARHRYHGRRLERATKRSDAIDHRWMPALASWTNFIGGRLAVPKAVASIGATAAHAPATDAPAADAPAADAPAAGTPAADAPAPGIPSNGTTAAPAGAARTSGPRP